MTDLDVLRQHRPEVPTPDPVTLARTRLALQNHQRPTRRLPQPRLLAAGALSSVLVGALLIGDVVGDHSSPPPGAAATASTFLAEAAANASANPDLPIPPGQYRYVTATTDNLWAHPIGKRWIDVRRHQQHEWWYPSTQRPPFVLRLTNWESVVDPAERKLLPGHKKHASVHGNICAAAVVGRTATWAVALPASLSGRGCKPSWIQPTPEFLARQPRDPEALYRTLSDPRKGGWHKELDLSSVAGRAELTFDRLAAVLLTGIVPQDLRSALYRAAQRIPGIQLQDKPVTVNGIQGRAVGIETQGYRTDLIIDPRTGRLLGARDVVTDLTKLTVQERRRIKGLEVGDVIVQSTVTTRISKTRPTVPAR